MSDLVGNPNCWFSHAQAHFLSAVAVHTEHCLNEANYIHMSGISYTLLGHVVLHVHRYRKVDR